MASYSAINNNSGNYGPYSQPGYNESSGYIAPITARKKKTSPWLKFGLPVAVLVVAGVVVGVIFGMKASKKNDGSSSSSSGSGAGSAAAASAAVSAKNAIGLFATATNSEFMVPVYPSATNTAAYSSPTFNQASDPDHSWPKDSFQPSSPNVLTVRPDRPLLIAPAYKWAALPTLIQNDPYMKAWNDTIFGNATVYYHADPVPYFNDNDGGKAGVGSGILDVARETKMRIKAFGYAYRMTNNTMWSDRAYREMQNAANYGSDPDRWNSAHFLDVGELSAAFAIGYDWMYDTWSDDQKSFIRNTVITYGLNFGVKALTPPYVNGWWSYNTTGNWNCVCNSGLTMAALAILNDDTTGTAKQILGLTIDSAKGNCALAVADDGTWDETANYWYFGTTGHAEMSASLISATGSDYGLLNTNPNFQNTGDFHMYVYGPTSLFDWGDHGPNKFSTTANAMLFYSSFYNRPEFMLHQRDRADAAEPWAMFWYDPTVSGAWWDGKNLDHFFDNQLDQWTSMRSSFTDENALFVAMKAGELQHHQTHNDLDVGDFVLDALGTRWAGEFGSANYNSPGYFNNDTQDSLRWMYYRKMTEGQNTILIGKANQLVTAQPTILASGSSNTTQGSSTVFDVPSDSTAFWVVDMTSAYGSATSVKRGVRMLSGRKQVLVQDEISASADIQWRMQTNATFTPGSSTATLTRDGKTLTAAILSPSGATFTKSDAVRFDTDVTPPEPDQDNPGISVLIIEVPAGDNVNIQVLFTPQWDGNPTFPNPPNVALDQWNLRSHDS